MLCSFACDGCVCDSYRILVDPSFGASLPLRGISRSVVVLRSPASFPGLLIPAFVASVLELQATNAEVRKPGNEASISPHASLIRTQGVKGYHL